MKVRLCEAMWRHHISGPTAYEFHEAIEEVDVDLVKEKSITLLNACKEFFDPEDEDYVISEIDDLIDELEMFDDEDYDSDDDAEEELDYILSEIYDFCDGYGIFIDLDVRPASEEKEETELHGDEFVDDDIGEGHPLDSEEVVEPFESENK